MDQKILERIETDIEDSIDLTIADLEEKVTELFAIKEELEFYRACSNCDHDWKQQENSSVVFCEKCGFEYFIEGDT